jgi:hypothetical protein
MSFMSCLTETDSAHVKISHVSALSTTLKASANDLALELWRTNRAQLH